MTFGIVIDVSAPIEVDDAPHAEVGRRSGGRADGLLLHVGRERPAGFQVLEVRESREQFDRCNAEVVGPALAQLPDGMAPPTEPVVAEFEARGLTVPAAHLVS